MLPGTSLREGLEALLRDDGTKGIVVLGEIGGEAEIEAAAFLQRWDTEVVAKGGRKKPVVGMVTGRTAPRGRVMGHAGAGECAFILSPLLLLLLLLLFPLICLSFELLDHVDGYGYNSVAGGSATAEDKIKALEAADVTMAVHPGEIGTLMRGLLEKEGLVPKVQLTLT